MWLQNYAWNIIIFLNVATICGWNQSLIKNFDQHSQETKLEDYLKQTRIDNSDWMCQRCWNYITAIIYFQNTTYEFSLDSF